MTLKLAVDAETERGRLLFGMIAEGYDGKQIVDRFAIAPDRIEYLVGLYVRRVVYANIPAAPSGECRISGYDGWCWVHDCYHPALP